MALTKKNFRKEPEFTIETSWDDGGVLDIKVATLLKKYDLPGTFYIIVDQVGKDGYLTWEQVKYLDSLGFEIGSHTVTHPSDLKLLHDEQLHYEIQNSKDMLETVLGHSVSKFCYPRGRFDDRVKDFVRRAEYKEARGTGRLGVTNSDDKFAMPGTIHVFQRPELQEPIVTYAIQTLDRVKKDGGYCNIWGHSKEIDDNNLWEVLEEILSYAKKVKGN